MRGKTPRDKGGYWNDREWSQGYLYDTKTVYVCYLDDNDNQVEGYFELVVKKDNYVEMNIVIGIRG